MGDEPAPTAPSGPTDHLDTVDYWRDLYKEAIDVGGDMLNERRAEIDSLRATLAEKDRRIGELEANERIARAALIRACHDSFTTGDGAARNYIEDARLALHDYHEAQA